MKTLSEFISPLLCQLDQKQPRKNAEVLTEKLVTAQTGKLWSLSEDRNEYNRNKSLLDGSLKTVVDTKKLNYSLLVNAESYFREKSTFLVLHDGSDIRKPHSKKLEKLDKVRDLDGNIINGYPTFNSVVVDAKGNDLRLLQTSPYSTKDTNYLPVGDIRDYHEGKLLKTRRLEVEKLLEGGDWYNHDSIVKEHTHQINTKIKSINEDALVIHIYDRGHDNSDLFAYHNANNSNFIIRLKTNRNSNELTSEFWNKKGKAQAIKLTDLHFMQGFEVRYEKVRFKKRTYQQVKGVFEWTTLELQGQTYWVVRVKFYDRKGQHIFKQPMILLTNMEVTTERMAQIVFEFYMKRSKIEAVFKFCKEQLGWEEFRIKPFEGIKNLLALVYFIAGYFYEVEKEVINHPAAQWLAQLGKGKGEVTPYFIIKGLAKVAHFIELQELFNQSESHKEMALDAMETFALRSKF